MGNRSKRWLLFLLGRAAGPSAPLAKVGEAWERMLQCTYVQLPQTSGFTCRHVHLQGYEGTACAAQLVCKKEQRRLH